MMLLYGRLTSINVQKVVWCLGELGRVEGRDYKRIDAGLTFGVNDTPEYLAMNPTGLVPTLVDGDFALWESNAIVRYLAADSPLFPASNPQLRASADRWMEWATGTLWAAVRVTFVGMTRTPEDQRDMAAIKASFRSSNSLLAIADAQLAKSRYCTGPQLTAGDIPLALTVHRWRNLAERFAPALGERDAYTHLERWYREIAERPSFQASLA